MSEYTQVDLQIGTEAQFETKKATLPEGVLVGLTDPIHENELDSALQTKLNGKASTSYVQGNPTESGTVDLTKLKIGNTVYNVPQGGTVDAYTKAETDALLDTKANVSDIPTVSTLGQTGQLKDGVQDNTHRLVTDSEKSTWNNKQTQLTDDQLNAVNSGITANKVSTYDGYAATINNKVDKVEGKGLSTNDFTTDEKNKLAGIEYVKANPTESGTTTLTKLKVGNTVYNVPQGGGGGVTSVTTSGSGNAVTGASISGSQLTLTKGSTFLTAHQSLDSCAKLSAANTFTGTNTFEKIVTIKGAGLKIESSQGSTTYNQGNIMYRPSTTSPDYILRMPAKDGTLALTSDIPTVEANPTASGTTTLTKLKVGSTVYTLPSGGGGTAGVSSLGGQTGAITLGDGLSMSNNQLVPKIKNIYLDSSDYLCIETN